MVKNILNNRQLINQASMYLCSLICVLGVFGNFISFLVFIRSGRKNPRIVTRNLLLLLTITNSIYLILFWVHRVLPKIVDRTSGNHNRPNSTTSESWLPYDLILANKNVYSCRVITYMINVAVCFNATVTVSFSIERALAINFPFATRNLRENYKIFFKFMLVLIFAFSFLFPVYNLILIGHVTNMVTGTSRCDVLTNHQHLYFILTIVFVVITLAIPFVLISVSNVSVLVVVYKSHRNMIERMGSWYDSGFVTTGVSSSAINLDSNQASNGKKSELRRQSSENANKSFINKNRRVRRSRDKNSSITTMLLAISASFVLLNFPYFLAWCNYAYSRIMPPPPPTNVQFQNATISERQAQNANYSFALVKITEILNLLNYAINGFLYFSTGKFYREHLFYLLDCRVNKPCF